MDTPKPPIGTLPEGWMGPLVDWSELGLQLLPTVAFALLGLGMLLAVSLVHKRLDKNPH